MARIASFHLIRERPRRAALALMRLGLDRPRLARTPGLAFWRLMGTGKGSDTGPGADLSRTALFAVWDDESDLDRFLEASRLPVRWAKAAESWHVRLRGVGGHGTWRGFDPLDGLDQGGATGPIVVITPSRRAPTVVEGVRAGGSGGRRRTARGTGLIDVVGIGEAPVGRFATFSLWASHADVRAFAYSMPRHQQVIEETRAGDWYSEEMFARFEPYGSTGTWGGRDPLAPFDDRTRTS